MVGGGSRRHWSDDGELANEIELYGELVVAASESDEKLTLPEIDAVLGVDAGDAGTAGKAQKRSAHLGRRGDGVDVGLPAGPRPALA